MLPDDSLFSRRIRKLSVKLDILFRILTKWAKYVITDISTKNRVWEKKSFVSWQFFHRLIKSICMQELLSKRKKIFKMFSWNLVRSVIIDKSASLTSDYDRLVMDVSVICVMEIFDSLWLVDESSCLFRNLIWTVWGTKRTPFGTWSRSFMKKNVITHS